MEFIVIMCAVMPILAFAFGVWIRLNDLLEELEIHKNMLDEGYKALGFYRDNFDSLLKILNLEIFEGKEIRNKK